MFFDLFGGKTKQRYTVTPSEYESVCEECEQLKSTIDDLLAELEEVGAILAPFNGIRRDDTVLEKVRSARDIIIADRAIIQQRSNAIDEMALLLGNAQKEAADKETEIRRLQGNIDALNTQGIRLLGEIKMLGDKLQLANEVKVALQQQQEMFAVTAPKKSTRRTTSKK